MKKIISLFTILSLGLCSLTINAQSTAAKELLSELDKTTSQLLEKNNVPGLAIAIIHKGQVIIKKGYGFSDVKSGIEVDEKTGFNIGSISKMFTAWGIMSLVEEGKLSLDDPMSKYISNWKLPQSEFDSRKITIKNLLEHTAGLSVHGYNGYNTKSELSSIKESLSGASRNEEAVKLIMEPETKWKYSGGGYSILQLIIEEVSGMSFERFMKRRIFKPLKMKNTSFAINKKVMESSAKAYDENGKQIPLRLFNAKAAAGLHTTLEDLVLFAKASMSENPVLTKESISLMRKPTTLSKGNYGMGYMVMNRFGNFTLSGHGGSNEGWQSGFMLDFNSDSGIIILTNGSSGRNVLFGSMRTWAKWYSNQ